MSRHVDFVHKWDADGIPYDVVVFLEGKRIGKIKRYHGEKGSGLNFFYWIYEPKQARGTPKIIGNAFPSLDECKKSL